MLNGIISLFRYQIRLLELFGIFSYAYWTDWTVTPYIGCIGMNGVNASKVITNKLGWPNALAVDIVNGRLWWGDAHLDYIE